MSRLFSIRQTLHLEYLNHRPLQEPILFFELRRKRRRSDKVACGLTDNLGGGSALVQVTFVGKCPSGGHFQHTLQRLVCSCKLTIAGFAESDLPQGTFQQKGPNQEHFAHRVASDIVEDSEGHSLAVCFIATSNDTIADRMGTMRFETL